MDLNLTDCEGRTPLSLAALKGHLPCVKYLLKIGCKHYDEHQKTPLHHAASNGCLDVVKYLMDHHSNMYSLNTSVSPLFTATYYGHLNIVKYFIEDKNCDPHITLGKLEMSLLHVAAYEGHTELVRYFVEDVKLYYMLQDKHWCCPPHYAALHGHIGILHYFITELKCDINTPTDDGDLPIHYAASTGQLDVVKYLLKPCNHDVIHYSNDAHHSTPRCAPLHSHLECPAAMKEIDPFCRNRFGNTALHIAAGLDKIEVVGFFVSTFGAKSLQIRNYYGQTALYVAVQYNNGLIALYLTVQTFMLL